MTVLEKALALVETIESGIAAGVEYFSIHGTRLFTVRDVLEALKEDHAFEFQEPGGERQRMEEPV